LPQKIKVHIVGSMPLIIVNMISGHWWLMPEILATWEAEIRRIAVGGQPRQTAYKTTSPK
jgi:hypothetical protein